MALALGTICAVLASCAVLFKLPISEACESEWLLKPANSTTKSEVRWKMVDVNAKTAVFRIARSVAYGTSLKYLSFAFATDDLMPSADLVVDCYQSSADITTIGSSQNYANYTNVADSRVSAEIRNASTSRTGTNVSCSFTMKVPEAARYAFLAAGVMASGVKKQHSEKFALPLPGNSCTRSSSLSTNPGTSPTTSSATVPSYTSSKQLVVVTSNQTRAPENVTFQLTSGTQPASQSTQQLATSQPPSSTSALLRSNPGTIAASSNGSGTDALTDNRSQKPSIWITSTPYVGTSQLVTTSAKTNQPNSMPTVSYTQSTSVTSRTPSSYVLTTSSSLASGLSTSTRSWWSTTSIYDEATDSGTNEAIDRPTNSIEDGSPRSDANTFAAAPGLAFNSSTTVGHPSAGSSSVSFIATPPTAQSDNQQQVNNAASSESRRVAGLIFIGAYLCALFLQLSKVCELLDARFG